MSNNISQSTQSLIQGYQNWYQSLQPKEGASTLHVDEVASRVASFYERVREVIGWKEEHLLRRAAIERILKRRLLAKKDGTEIAEPLVLELIRGGHFPNDKIEEGKIDDIKKSIDKYIFILENTLSPPKKKIKLQFYDWLSAIAACEVEEVLQPPLKERALMDYMEKIMKERIEVREGKIIEKKIPQEEKAEQIFIGIRRALFKLDSPIIGYHLLKRRYPNWFDLSPIQLQEISQNIYLIWEEINQKLNHPSANKFYKVCQRYDTPYLILGDIIESDSSQAPEILKNPEVLETKIGEAYAKRLQRLKGRLRRAAVYATLSIFLTKVVAAFAIEVPFDKYIGEFSYSTLILNTTIPPLLMFFLVLTIRPPRKENLNRVIMEVMKIVYPTERREIYEIKWARKRGIFLNIAVVTFYILSFIVTFGLIIWGLNRLHFSILSQIIFLIFVSLIFFAGVKIRERSRELIVEEKKEGILHTLIDFFSLPVVRMGRWLTGEWEKHNFLVVMFNSLIDMPFQVFVEFIEHWREFLKEKKEEIY